MEKFLRVFAGRVKERAGWLAVSDETRSLTYDQLDCAADRLAGLLSLDRASENDLVGYLGRMTVDCVTNTVAAAKAGTGIVALDPSFPKSALKELVDHSGMARIAAPPEYAALAASLLDAPPVIIPQDVPDRAAVPVFAPVPADPEALFAVTYTSGSTGRPKGVPNVRRIAEDRWQRPLKMFPPAADDRVAQFNTFWWAEQLYPLALGLEIHCFDFGRRGAAELDSWMREKRISFLSTYTAMYRQLAASAAAPFPDLKRVLIAGEAVRRADFENFVNIALPGAIIGNRYGAQEFGSILLYTHRCGDPVPYDFVPMGKSFFPDAVRLLDEDGREAADGEPGEVTVTADFVPDGYHNDPERTAQVFRREANGLMTCAHGDLAYRDHAGIYHSFGRKDQQIKIRGYNVRPPEVEQVLLEHPGVKAAAVAPFDGRHGIRRLACYFVPEPGVTVSRSELRAFMAEKVPNYMVPGVFTEMERLPVTATGKLNLSGLPDPMAGLATGTAAAGGEALSGVEALLAHAWSDVLGHADFGPDDDFFDVGGDSLQAMAMLVAVERDTQIRVPLESLILDGASIRSLAARIGTGVQNRDVTPPVAMKRTGDRPPFFAAHVMGGHLSDYLALQAALDARQPFYGLHPRGMDGRSPPDTSIEAIAAHCIRAMKLQQPDGPYRLIGYSFGAYVAYEMACQLHSRGEAVSRLVLLDPGVSWQEPLRFVKAVYRPLRYQQDLRKGWERLSRTVPAAFGLRLPPSQLDEAHYGALMKYHPRPMPLPHVLLVSAMENKQQADIKRHWRTLIGPQLQIVDNSGDHSHLVRAPHAWTLAQKIEGWLASLEAEPPLPHPMRAAG